MHHQAALVMWWNIAADVVAEFEEWHSVEHLPERLAIPGFLRGTRWKAASGAARYFVVYETRDIETLSSAAYMQRLNHPSDWSAAMFPRFRDMVRSPCVVQAGFRRGIGGVAATVRFAPAKDQAAGLAMWLTKSLLPQLAVQPGMVAASLMQSQAPTPGRRTIEQELRGGDGSADWVLYIQAYDAAILGSVCAQSLSEKKLEDHGASPGAVTEVFQIAHSLATSAGGYA